MNITANAASLNWRTNNHGVWRALVKDMAPNSSVTFSDGLTGTVAGRQVTVESPSMPTGFMTYTTDDNTAVFGGVLYGAGTASDSLEAVGGEKTVRMGSVDLGTLTWIKSSNFTATKNCFYTDWTAFPVAAKGITTGYQLPNAVCDEFIGVRQNASIWPINSWVFTSDPGLLPRKSFGIIVELDQYADATAFQTAMSGVILYYELVEPITSTETAQSMSLEQGSDTIGGGSFSATYEGTEYEIQLVKGCKYIHRDEAGVDHYLTPSATTQLLVKGGVSKVIDLTEWFGKGFESASAVAFYALYPTWKTYDIPYIRAQVINYKGTGVQTIGFNAYNHATGTAELLGGNKYQICGTYTSVSYVDQWGEAEELELNDKGIFTPTNNGTLTVVGGNATDTCVHLCWSGYKNFGEREYQWEPFVRNTHDIDIVQYFPEGMNGVQCFYATFYGERTANDELYVDHLVKRVGITDLASLTWTFQSTSTYGLWRTTDLASSIKPSTAQNTLDTAVRCSEYPGGKQSNSLYGDANNIGCFSVMPSGTIVVNTGSTTEKPRGLIIYELATPVVTQLPSPINLTYPVNDFGTEQSLPVNTTDLVTTDLHALIRYNTDYMRMNTQLSEIFPTVRSLAQQEQDGEIMKTDATAPNATVGNAYNLIDRNAAGTERQFSFDTSGGTQDIADGTAIAKKVMGTTLNLNQLVHDTNENTVESVNGEATVTDAVEGNVKHLVVSGDTVVVNQLVKEYVEKTESGSGRIWIKDAFETEAKGLKVTAPRSVVMNQRIYNGNFADNSHWSGSNNAILAITNNVGTLTASSTLSSMSFNASTNLFTMIVGHTYLYTYDFKLSLANGDTTSRIVFNLGLNASVYYDLTDNWRTLKGKITASSIVSYNQVTIYGNIASGDYASLRNLMCVDLTQYFNGNQTLIDSIRTWDDLVAYDSAFASYAQYNTGTVKGVTPALTLNGAAQPFATAPQEMFGVGDVRDEWSVVEGKYTKRVESYTFNGTEAWGAYANNTFGYSIVGKKVGLYNILMSDYLSYGAVAYTTLTDKEICGNETNDKIYIRDTAYSDATAFAAHMAGKTVYYVHSSVTDVTPVAFNLVSYDNTIFQTSGDLQAGIEATYDGLNQTIALDPAHTYAFNHQYVEDSIITGESSIDCVGTEDNLVDLTQLYAGDATRIAAIHSWASLSSRIHMYRDWLPYNPGEIVNLSATIRVYQHEYAYGIVYDPSQSSPACQRVELHDGVLTEVEEFSSLTVHEKFFRCVMDDLSTRHINYYLDDEDSTKKYNGTRNGVTSDGSSSVLTGADGDVMVEIPITYWSLDEDYDGTGKILWLVSDTPFTGSEIHDFFYVSPNGDEARTQYVGAYRAVVSDAEGNALNTTEGAITQNAGTASTRLLRSVAGALPFNNVALASMRDAAIRNGGSHVNRLFHEYLLMMMTIEQASLNCQSISMGYSNGKTYALWAWRKSGRTNYGNGTGQTMAVANSSDDDNFYSLKVNNVQLYRDANRDADGYFAWSNHAATPTVYWTESNTPGNGAVAYSDSTGTDSGYVTASWSTTADANKVIQFQYRGIENPFGECWEFDDGVQKYQKAILAAIKVNNIVHYVNHLKDGSGTKTAWTSEDGTSTYWTTTATPGNNSVAYSDDACTTDSGYKITQNTFVRVDCEMWESVSMADYTSTDQHTTSSKAYDRKRHYWSSGSWIKKFDPRSFLPRTLGGSGSTYLCDNWYNDNGTGSRVVYRGGSASSGVYDGLGYVSVYSGLAGADVSISGRLSA